MVTVTMMMIMIMVTMVSMMTMIMTTRDLLQILLIQLDSFGLGRLIWCFLLIGVQGVKGVFFHCVFPFWACSSYFFVVVQNAICLGIEEVFRVRLLSRGPRDG